VLDQVPEAMRDRLGIAIRQQAYKAYRDALDSDRWQRWLALAAHYARSRTARGMFADDPGPRVLNVALRGPP
jgi:transaldolase